MKIGKKIVFGMAIALALFFSGCGESAEDKAIKENKAKVELATKENSAKVVLFQKIEKIKVNPKPENSNDFLEQVDLLKKEFAKDFGDKKVELWIEEFKKEESGTWLGKKTMYIKMRY